MVVNTLLLVGVNSLAVILSKGLVIARVIPARRFRAIRQAVGARRKFFQHLEALTTYLAFENWERLMDFMRRGLEIGPYAAPQKS